MNVNDVIVTSHYLHRVFKKKEYFNNRSNIVVEIPVEKWLHYTLLEVLSCNTIDSFLSSSPSSYYYNELESVLHMRVKQNFEIRQLQYIHVM